MKIKNFPIDIYNTNIYIVHDKKESKIFDYLALEWNMNIEEEFENNKEFTGLSYMYIHQCFILLTTNEVSTLIHEIIHCTNRILDRVGIKVSPDEDEAQAYLAAFIYEQYKKTKWDVLK